MLIVKDFPSDSEECSSAEDFGLITNPEAAPTAFPSHELCMQLSCLPMLLTSLIVQKLIFLSNGAWGFFLLPAIADTCVASVLEERTPAMRNVIKSSSPYEEYLFLTPLSLVSFSSQNPNVLHCQSLLRCQSREGARHGQIPRPSRHTALCQWHSCLVDSPVLWTHLLLTLSLHSSVCRPHLCPQVEGHVSVNFWTFLYYPYLPLKQLSFYIMQEIMC